ncbi:hypothetical protein RLO149_c034130 [Roseobacter litoralis Och 149]|uniref:Uncharacterized protein n=1 Tax=Roseobacter litoralis (strain ATCC 49566 / DSM 6996 / JCM 21268 / NBRC 15278 / OCh 149) TaxID=391595 RepID=F7ZLW0_ROSLO|nr:hypothetical protein RLO149_c034130 [Roseobacter litoralis Och 149]
MPAGEYFAGVLRLVFVTINDPWLRAAGFFFLLRDQKTSLPGKRAPQGKVIFIQNDPCQRI